MKLCVKPFYGWGWRGLNGSLDVPLQFDLEIEETLPSKQHVFQVAIGRVTLQGHPLEGLWVTLTPRHTKPDDMYNLAAFSERPDLSGIDWQQAEIAGFAEAFQISN
jgi:hypothetical protein